MSFGFRVSGFGIAACALLLALGDLLAAQEAEAPATTAPAQVTADPARDLLTKQAPIWYDRERDGWRRVETRRRERPVESPASGGGGSGLPEYSLPVGPLAWLLLALVVIGAALLLREMLRDHVLDEGAGAEGQRRSVDPALLSALPFAYDAGDPEQALAEALAAGDWRKAVVCLYACQLLALDRAGAIRLAAGTTNRAYLRVARAWCAERPSRSPVRVGFEAAMVSFERVYFGHHEADAALLEQLRGRHQALLAALRGEEGGP